MATSRPPLIERSVLSDRVKDHLLQAILTGEYTPGSRIVETRVARDLGVSQAPVREALRDLEAVGVVEITAFQGARVRQLSKAELLEAYGIRAELESLGARLALPRLSDADFDELQGYVDEMERAAAAGDRHAEAIVDATFHTRVIEIAGNTTLERVWRYLEPVSRTYITLVVPGINALQVADLHQPILDALRRRDPDQAEEAIRRHFLTAGTMFDTQFAVENPTPVDATANVVASAGR
ncbi:MAG TPA: GntR family transcriptional regulator [Candidatus Limnocylindrales bacterium]